MLAGMGGWIMAPRASRAAVDELPARVRLLVGQSENQLTWMAGVELSLQPGWKTYWRSPGGSGIPPLFDWSGSTNLRRATINFPAPTLLGEGDGAFLGYTGQIVFPVAVEPIDPARRVDLALDLSYGLCSKVCIPAENRMRRQIGQTAEDEQDNALLQRFMARVPQKLPAGSVTRDWVYDRQNKRLEFSADLPGGIRFVAVEGPVDWGLSLPATPVAGETGRYRVTADAVPDKAADTALRVTVVGARASVEEIHTLDG